MYERLLKCATQRSFFLFGARGCGKSTLLEKLFPEGTALWIDLLDTEQYSRFLQYPSDLYRIATNLPEIYTHIVIDEVQKVPLLLNEVQRLMRKKKIAFILSGSSARKLKQGAANLLAGRAFVYHLYPLTHKELSKDFNLELAMRWGTLPEIVSFSNESDRHKFLQAYVETYLKEEIWDEHFIRQLPPFRRFLEVAAQSNGKLINYSNIAQDVGVDDKTVKAYYSILEDTLLGFYLEPFHNSFRKRLNERPKFYFFDTGVVHELTKTSSVPLMPHSKRYGDTFGHWIVLEIQRLASYLNMNFRLSFIRTASGVEADLVIERPNKVPILLEIKSSQRITEKEMGSFMRLTRDFGECEAIVLSQDPYVQTFEHVTAYPWKQGLDYIVQT
jgi:uncharacterized protein